MSFFSQADAKEKARAEAEIEYKELEKLRAEIVQEREKLMRLRESSEQNKLVVVPRLADAQPPHALPLGHWTQPAVLPSSYAHTLPNAPDVPMTDIERARLLELLKKGAVSWHAMQASLHQNAPFNLQRAFVTVLIRTPEDLLNAICQTQLAATIIKDALQQNLDAIAYVFDTPTDFGTAVIDRVYPSQSDDLFFHRPISSDEIARLHELFSIGQCNHYMMLPALQQSLHDARTLIALQSFKNVLINNNDQLITAIVDNKLQAFIVRNAFGFNRDGRDYVFRR